MASDQHLFELRRVRLDTPGFRGIECIEVEAKSVINPVPGSALPFSWTINPYRGCTHACVYCYPFSILTKGTLIRRDIGLLVEASRVTQVSAALSIGTLDEGAWRATEPGTPHPRERMETVAALNEAGIPCAVLMAPILPGITDDPGGLGEVVRAAIEAGATSVSPILLHLRPGVREEFLPWLAEHHPDLVGLYERTYPGSYASKANRRQLSGTVAAIRRSLGGTRPQSDERGSVAVAQPAPRQLRLTDRPS